MDKRAFQFSPVQRYLDRIYEELLDLKDGAVADYIPELARADPSWFGIALVTVDGHVYQVGDACRRFTIQSISKAITYGLALEDRGHDRVLSKVGVEPSGEAFNSISLEPGTGRPMNPMINAGAIATTGLIQSKPDAPPMQRILEAFGRYTGRPMEIDETLYRSESKTGHRNRAIAHLLLGQGILDRTPEDVLDLYFRQCSILVTARDLATMGACLANNGVNPVTGVAALQSRYVEKVLSVMSTCGMYDFSGAWLYDIGMPAKSGVGGGIMAVLPGQFGLGVFSPRLDEKGNSLRGIEACKRLSKDFSLHLFHVPRSTSATVTRQVYDGAKRRSSRRRRNGAEIAVLAAQGHRIRVYELQGELLFGSAESVGFEILSELAGIDYLVVDLKRVIGTDQASILVLSELCMRVADEGKRVFFTDTKNLHPFRKNLQGDAYRAQEPRPLHFEDTDHAVEWCENQLIAEADTTGTDTSAADLSHQYLCTAMTGDELEALRQAGRECEFNAGSRIFEAGDRAESMFFIFSGEIEVEVRVDAGAGHHSRLSSLGPGMVFGEVALVNRKRRTASASAVMDTRCLELRFDAIPDALLVKMLMSMASHFANKIESDTQLIQQLA